MSTVGERRAAFRALHERGSFVLPNPWDRGSARYLAAVAPTPVNVLVDGLPGAELNALLAPARSAAPR